MDRQNVRSSQIKSIGYSSTLKVLEIEFNSGGVYQYFDVPEELYKELMTAPSHGTYFSRNIKNKFVYKKLS
jgi:hypothetical protein